MAKRGITKAERLSNVTRALRVWIAAVEGNLSMLKDRLADLESITAPTPRRRK